MSQSYYELDRVRAEIVLAAMIQVETHRNWHLRAAHVKPKHVHMVVLNADKPKRILVDIKSYASRALTAAGYEYSGRKRWTRGGSAPYLWYKSDVDCAVHYLLHEQGKIFVTYEKPTTDTP